MYEADDSKMTGINRNDVICLGVATMEELGCSPWVRRMNVEGRKAMSQWAGGERGGEKGRDARGDLVLVVRPERH